MKIKEVMLRLMYLEMFGYDVLFGYIYVVKVCVESDIVIK